MTASTLFDVNKIPEAPKQDLPELEFNLGIGGGLTPKRKRKSYYVPVADRVKEKADAKKIAKVEKKKELALRDGKDLPEPNARKRKELAKASKVVKVVKAEPKKGSDKTMKPIDSGKCTFCGKPLSRHSSVENGMGDICAQRSKTLPTGWTMESHYATVTVDEIPEGYIKLKDAYNKAVSGKVVSGYRFLQACGGNRMIRPPLNENFKVVFVGNTRYVNGASLKHLKELIKE